MSIMNNLDKGMQLVVITYDLSRAFDILNPVLIVEKLEAIGIQSYLTERKIVVKVNGAFSKPYRIESGTPQGSILAPLLFIIYINDMSQYVTEGEIFTYADDTNIVIAGETVAKVENHSKIVMRQFDDWCGSNGLQIIHCKTSYINFNSMHCRLEGQYDLSIDGTTLVRKRDFRILGTIFDEHLTFSSNINDILLN